MRRILMFCSSALLAVTLHAGTIVFDNSLAASDGTDAVPAEHFNSFSMPGYAGLLSKVTVVLKGDDTTGGTISVGLYANDFGDVPGILLSNIGTIVDAALSGTFTPIDVALTANPLLNANTRYWIGLTSSDTSAVWSYSLDLTGTGVANEFSSSSAGSSLPDTAGLYQMAVEIDPAAAPEPATLWLGGTALVALGVFRRRITGSARR